MTSSIAVDLDISEVNPNKDATLRSPPIVRDVATPALSIGIGDPSATKDARPADGVATGTIAVAAASASGIRMAFCSSVLAADAVPSVRTKSAVAPTLRDPPQLPDVAAGADAAFWTMCGEDAPRIRPSRSKVAESSLK